MSEYMWANIKIGGSISRPVLTHLAEKFDVSLPLSKATHYLELEDTEALWGRFAEMEAYLVQQTVPFDRLSDGGYEFSPELRKFRPRLTDGGSNIGHPEVDRTFLCDHNNHPAVTATDIERAIAETRTREEFGGASDRAMRPGHTRPASAVRCGSNGLGNGCFALSGRASTSEFSHSSRHRLRHSRKPLRNISEVSRYKGLPPHAA